MDSEPSFLIVYKGIFLALLREAYLNQSKKVTQEEIFCLWPRSDGKSSFLQKNLSDERCPQSDKPPGSRAREQGLQEG